MALRNNVANPALSAGDPILANVFDQRGAARPQPGGTLPDLGAVELNQPLSTAATDNNDVLTGTNAVNKLTGLAGADYLKGLGGNDTLEGGLESDLLDGGPGNDTLQGGLGLDLAAYPGAAGVIIDLSGTTDTAKRGGEKDTLIGIEGALGSNAADTFKGDALNNEFQGKTGKDTMTGGAGRDTWDFNDVADSPAGATRDLVTDFVPGQDVIDLAGVDADSTVPGNQSFRWVAQGQSHRRRAARLFRQRRHDHRARQHRRRCGSRARDPAHRHEDADRGRLPAVTSGPDIAAAFAYGLSTRRRIRMRVPRTVTMAPCSSSAACPPSTACISPIRSAVGTCGRRITPACAEFSRRMSVPKSLSMVIRMRLASTDRRRMAASPGSGPASVTRTTSCPASRSHSASARPAQLSTRNFTPRRP